MVWGNYSEMQEWENKQSLEWYETLLIVDIGKEKKVGIISALVACTSASNALIPLWYRDKISKLSKLKTSNSEINAVIHKAAQSCDLVILKGHQHYLAG